VTERRPIQVRLVLGALALLIAIVAVLGTSQVLTARDSQRREINNGELTAAHLASSALASALASRLALISNLAAQPQLSTLFTASNPKQQTKLAAALHLLYPGFASFDVISATGRLDARWPADPAVIGKNVSTSDFFTGVMHTRRPYVSEALQQTAPPSELAVGLAAPVTDSHGQIVGILQGTLAASAIGSMIGGTSLRGGGQLVIIDQAGHALTGPAAGALRSFNSLAPVKSALAGQTGTANNAVPGYSGTRLTGYAPVASVGWAVIAENPRSALDAPLAALTERLVAIGLIVLLLAIGTALLVGMLLRRLRREHDQAGALLSSVGEGVATLSPTGTPILISPALERLAGRPAGELIGQPWSDAIALYDHHGQPICWEDSIAFQAIRDGHVVASSGYDLHLARPDGQRIPVLLTASPLLAGGELLGAVIVLRDVSHEREVDQLKSSLVSTVSHELRTPLTMIQGFSELLLDRGNMAATRSREALEQIQIYECLKCMFGSCALRCTRGSAGMRPVRASGWSGSRRTVRR
jgi:PAS domain S-box-containing protein